MRPPARASTLVTYSILLGAAALSFALPSSLGVPSASAAPRGPSVREAPIRLKTSRVQRNLEEARRRAAATARSRR
jgi:hypothetical protein